MTSESTLCFKVASAFPLGFQNLGCVLVTTQSSVRTHISVFTSCILNSWMAPSLSVHTPLPTLLFAAIVLLCILCSSCPQTLLDIARNKFSIPNQHPHCITLHQPRLVQSKDARQLELDPGRSCSPHVTLSLKNLTCESISGVHYLLEISVGVHPTIYPFTEFIH